ncbi:MAG TPA: citrate (Si)-synthase, partial [Anaerolineae bacterium]|nr:citrate (Si)-synthase [Anaerolineae bacterium]
MPDTLTITDDRTGSTYQIPIEHGTLRAMDLRQIKTDENDFGLMSYDPGYINTASTKSGITFIDGEKGILRYRGYPIEQLAKESSFLEVAFLILFGELPNREELEYWVRDIHHQT